MTPLDQIKTIVVLMLENRSFDHLLGTLSLPGPGQRRDVDGLTGEVSARGDIASPAYANPANGLIYWPYVLDHDESAHTDLPHIPKYVDMQLGFSSVNQRYAMNGFARAYYQDNPGNRVARCPAMSVYPLHLLPMTKFLAQNYTICDRWFTPVPSDTHPNRLIALSGYTRIEANRPTLLPEQHIVMDWLSENRVRWRVYTEGLSFIHLMRQKLIADREHFRHVSTLHDDFRDEPDRTFPQVIFIEPGYYDDPLQNKPNDCHPPLPMGPGEAFLWRVYQAVTGNRERWQSTVMVVHYDEHGGFFDHVPPLGVETLPPPGQHSPRFSITGPRVPAFIVSPFVNPGEVYHGNLDHTSVLRFLAETFTPGKPYSDIVHARHGGPGQLTSVAGALTRTSPRPDVPRPPRVPVPYSLPTTGPRPIITPGQRIFALAHEAAGTMDGKARDALYQSMI